MFVIGAAVGLAATASAGGSARDTQAAPVSKSSHCSAGYVPKGGRCVRSRKCRRPGLRSIARTPTARLLAGDSAENEGEYYGCLFSRDRMRLLRSIETECFHTCERIHTPRLAGRFAAFVYNWDFSYGAGVPEEHDAYVEVYDLKDGRQLRRYATAYPRPAVLLVAENADSVTLDGGELYLHRRGGADTLLDAGDISPASVRIEGRTVWWTNAGEERKTAF